MINFTVINVNTKEIAINYLGDALFPVNLESFSHGIMISLDHNDCASLRVDGEFSWRKTEWCCHLVEHSTKFLQSQDPVQIKYTYIINTFIDYS